MYCTHMWVTAGVLEGPEEGGGGRRGEGGGGGEEGGADLMDLMV